MKMLGKEGYVEDSVMVLEVTEEDLEIIKKGVDFVYDKTFCKKVYNSSGNHAHVIMIRTSSYSVISKGIETLLKDFESVSWWNKEQTKFCIKRRR